MIPQSTRIEARRNAAPRKPQVPTDRLTCAVIVVSHNYGRFLSHALDSVLLQTRKASEIVVVDDSSSDETAAVAGQYANRGVRYVRGEWRNVNRAREAGMNATQAPIVLFLDADDALGTDYLEAGIPLFDTDITVGIVYTDCERFGMETGRLVFPEPEGGNIVAQNFAHAGSLIRRSALELSGAFDDYPTRETQDDWYMWKRIAAAGWRPVKSPSVYHYRRHAASHTTELRAKERIYFDLAGLRHETITLFVPLSGRKDLWPSFSKWLERQTWPSAQTRLVLCDTSQSLEFATMVRDWIRRGHYPDVRYYQQAVGKPGLADDDRYSHQVRVDVRAAMCRIYNRLSREATTEFVWIVEDDILPPLDTARRLLRGMDDRVGSVSGAYLSRFQTGYVAWHNTSRLMILPEEAREGLQAVRGNGFGCVMLRRSLMQKQVFQNAVPHHDYDPNFYEWMATQNMEARIDWSVKCEHRHSGCSGGPEYLY